MMNYLRRLFGPKNASSVVFYVKNYVYRNSFTKRVAGHMYEISYSERGSVQHELCLAGAKRLGLTNLNIPENEKVAVRFTVERV